MLFSHPVALVGAAALGALTVQATVSRQWRRLRDVVVVAAVTGTAMIGVYAGIDHPGHTAGLSEYWTPFFPSLTALPGYLVARLDQLAPVLGLPWPVLVALAAVGVVTVARMRRPATATALLLLPVISACAGMMRWYPLLDQRTSHFLLVTAAVLAGIGVVGIGYAVATAFARAMVVDPTARPRLTAWLATLVVILAVAGYGAANRGWLSRPRSPAPATEDIEAQVAYVALRRGPADTILVNLSGQFGFAYYWKADQPQFERGGPQAVGWYLDYPPRDHIVIATDRDAGSVYRAVLAAHLATTTGGRIWLVRSHVDATGAGLATGARRRAGAGHPRWCRASCRARLSR